MFAGFILLSGVTHAMDAVMFWWPAQRLGGLSKFLTAIMSASTAVVLYRQIPVIFALRSVLMLEQDLYQQKAVESKLRKEIQKLKK